MAVDRRRAPVELRSGLRPVDYYNNLQRATRAIYNERSEVIYSETIYNKVIYSEQRERSKKQKQCLNS